MVIVEPTPIADPVAALVAHLRAQPAVAGGVLAGRVFAEQLPGAEVASMPRTVAVLRSAGGPGFPRHMPIVVLRIDVTTYGRTHAEAASAQWVLASELTAILRVRVRGTLLHAVTSSGGPLSGRDPDTEWPQIVASWSLMAAEEAP